MRNNPGIVLLSVTAAGGAVKLAATERVGNIELHVGGTSDVKLRIDGGTYVALYAGRTYTWVNVDLNRFEIATDQAGAQTAILCYESPGR